MFRREASRRKRCTHSSRAYFIREGAEFCLLLAGLTLAGSITIVPLWIWITLPIGKALASILFYIFFLKRSFLQRPRHDLSSLIGQKAHTLAPLDPTGQVKLNGEIWLARSCSGEAITSHQDVLIREIRGRLLLVERQPDREAPLTPTE